MVHHRWLLLLGLIAYAFAGCTAEQTAGSGRVSSALTEGQLEVGFPGSFNYGSVALWAQNGLRLAPGVVVETDADEPGAVLNVGSGTLTLGGNAHTGSIVSAGNISMDGGALVMGDAQAGGSIAMQAGADVTGNEYRNTPIGPLASIRFTVLFKAATQNVLLQNGANGELDPATSYGKVTVNPGSTLTLAADEYHVQDLQVEPNGVLYIDTQNGPVLLHVKSSLMFKGKLSADASAFLMTFHGTETSIESPWSGTFISTTAKLRLAPVGATGHRGSFFAREIDAAEANSRIVYQPYAHWYALVDLHPLLECVRRGKYPRGAALLGYTNESDFPVSVPRGVANAITANVLPPAEPALPPIVLLPGEHLRDFWAPFDLASPIFWTLAGETVVATGDSILCELGQVPPQEEVEPSSTSVPMEDPSGVAHEVIAEITPDVISSHSSSLPAPIFGGSYHQMVSTPPSTSSSAVAGDIGMIQQPLYRQTTPPTEGPFTFEITEFRYNRDEGCVLSLCGSYDAHLHALVIDGQWVGQSNSGTVQVSRSKPEVYVTFDVWDDDGSGLGSIFTGGGDQLESYVVGPISTLTGGSACTSGNIGSVCWRAVGTSSPDICFNWQAEFLDVKTELKSYPASFARIEASMWPPGAAESDWEYTGALDNRGCIPPNYLPIREEWEKGKGTIVTFRLTSQICYDALGGHCLDSDHTHPGPGEINVSVQFKGQTGPESYCWTYAEDEANATPGCDRQNFSWANTPTNAFSFDVPVVSTNRPDWNGVTRAAAVMSKIFAREHETGGGLGVATSLINRKYNNTTRVITVEADTPGYKVIGSERNGDRLTYRDETGDPGSDLVAGTRFKHLVAHEFGHLLQGNGQGEMGWDYGPGNGNPEQDWLCKCTHVATGQDSHCLQSMEEPGATMQEGFVHFFATAVWDSGSDCTFIYYKSVLNTECMPGVRGCRDYEPAKNVKFSLNPAPVPVNCAVPALWRNTHCADSKSSHDILSYGTEYDWMNFYRAIHTTTNDPDRWPLLSIFDAYVKGCLLFDSDATSCAGVLMSWDGGNFPSRPTQAPQSHGSLSAGVNELVGANSTRANLFFSNGRTYGVNTEAP